MKKNLIIGGCTGYNYNQIKPWVESIDSVVDIGKVDRVLVVGIMDDSTKYTLLNRGWTLIQMPQADHIPIHVLRFFSIYDFLKEYWKQYDYVVTTDVRDVYFQQNPFDCVEVAYHIYSKHLVVGSESLKYKDEPWGNNNLLQCYGEYVHNIFKENTIYNVGVIGGKAEYVKDLVFNIFTNALGRPITIVDQAVFNVLINTKPYNDDILFVRQTYNWVCHAGTTADPTKIDYFRPNLLEPEPKFVDGVVYSSRMEPFAIVHQYDRVPEWNDMIIKKYNLNGE